MRMVLRVIAGITASLLSTAAGAETLQVSDASQLKWDIYGGKVYFRNFNAIDPSWQGCCFFYFIDLSSDEGKAMFSAFLTRNAAHQPISFWVADKTASPSQITQEGDW